MINRGLKLTGWILLIVVCCAATMIGLSTYFGWGAVKGNGNLVEKTFCVDSLSSFTFKNVNLQGGTGAEITLLPSEGNPHILFKTDENLADDFEYSMDETSGSIKGKWYKKYQASELKITIYSDEIKALSIGSKSKLNLGIIEKDFTLSISGSTEGSAVLNTNSFIMNTSGSSKMTFTGRADNFRLSTSGSSTVSASQFTAKNITVKTSGSTNLYLSGVAERLILNSSGSSEINGKEMVCKNVEMNTSGSSKVTISVSEQLKIKSSGSTHVVYYGSPIIEKDVSGAADIRQGTN